MANNKISIFYLSTADRDYVLVQEDNVKRLSKLSQSPLVASSSESDAVRKHLLALPQTLRVFQLPSKAIRLEAFALLKVFFEPRKSEKFISFSFYEDEPVSLMLDDDSFAILTKFHSHSSISAMSAEQSLELRSFMMCDSFDSANGNYDISSIIGILTSILSSPWNNREFNESDVFNGC